MEPLRKWTMTLAALAFGVGVLLIGLRGWMPEAQAQEGSAGVVCEFPNVMASKDKYAEGRVAWIKQQVAAGRRNIVIDPASLYCAW